MQLGFLQYCGIHMCNITHNKDTDCSDVNCTISTKHKGCFRLMFISLMCDNHRSIPR